MVFKKSREKSAIKSGLQKSSKKKSILKLKRKLKQIEQSMIRTTNQKIYEKLEKEREEIDGQINKTIEILDRQSTSGKRNLELFERVKQFFENPQELRKK